MAAVKSPGTEVVENVDAPGTIGPQRVQQRGDVKKRKCLRGIAVFTAFVEENLKLSGGYGLIYRAQIKYKKVAKRHAAAESDNVVLIACRVVSQVVPPTIVNGIERD